MKSKMLTIRLNSAERALEATQGDGDTETNLVDLLTDLMHLAFVHDIGFNKCLDRATNHYEEEVIEENESCL